VVRIAYLVAYALLAALGEALVARPALLWLRGQGLLRPSLPWDVPYGGIALLCAALVAVMTLWLASDAALGRRPRVPQHAVFLLFLAICFAVRSQSDPRPPRDPTPSLLDGLRAAAAELDRDYRGSYTPDAGQLNSALAQVTPPGYRRLGRSIPLHARVLSGADGPQVEALPGDLPGTIYVAISKDRTTAWTTALGLHGVLKPRIEAHAGTHSAPGRDPLVPIYPRSR
jgi:hypothetical protein